MMQSYAHDEIAALEKENWWYESRRRLIAQYLPEGWTAALDAGCGVGANSSLLGLQSFGLDSSSEAVLHSPYSKMFLGSIEDMPYKDEIFDLVLCTDVLEHVDDIAAIREIHRVLKSGGRAIITVPAYMSLWNENDDYAHHLRRYTKASLQNLLGGFEITTLHHWDHLFFLPMWILARSYKKQERPKNNLRFIPRFLNQPLIWWMDIERYLHLPFGVSFIVVAIKK